MTTCEHSDIGCVVGEEEDPQTVQGVWHLGEIQVTKNRDGRNEEMHLQRQTRRHVRHHAFQGNGSEDPQGRQGVLGGSEGGPVELLDGWRGREAETSD